MPRSASRKKIFRPRRSAWIPANKFILVDTREESEWARGHIPGAIHLGKGVIERDIEKTIPDKDTTIVLYCGGGFRSALAADNLQKMGYHKVDFHGRRLAQLDRSRLSRRERLGERRTALGWPIWLGRLDSNQHRPH